ncbi:uncharacterized protein BX663DRAFT_551725 [Cokeromyces recurvatus]|uniref:uncharacterized protein n=1 Tax=Cokeromyces recurvatus TaxID=90255 RepID=UPI00221E6CEC|nr:uncharacterized protein BX663DRAFT_551725 [Cokeromyces recurvatus]KAI7902856.1 hypothetical protein BX663DRAFT_551725 [Cokeromyces recurvatus]
MPTTDAIIDESFDIFGDVTPEEERLLEARQEQFRQQLETKIAQFSSNPIDRTLQQNRFIFTQRQRQHHFTKPVQRAQLLSREECRSILDICSKQEVGWTTDRHSAFATTDIPIRTAHESPLRSLEALVKERLFPELAAYYGFKVSDLEFRDIFLVKYTATGQRGLRLHQDGCLFSVTVLISHEDDFEGGGTYYKSIDDIVYLKQGDCAYHDAHVMHSGVDISKGERYVLVGFIDTLDTIEKDKIALLRS